MTKAIAHVLAALLLAAALVGCGDNKELPTTIEADSSSGQGEDTIYSENGNEGTDEVAIAELPPEFSACAHDDEYFQPNSDDFIVISYETRLMCWEPCWYRNNSGVMEYGPYRDEMVSEGIAKVTYIESFDGDAHLGTKVRVEYEAVESAMLAGLVHGYNIVPIELGYPNEQDDALITEDYFEAADRMLFSNITATDYDVTYQGHFDNFRYFEFRPQETANGLKCLADIPLSDLSEAMVRVPFRSLSYRAGETAKITITNYQRTYEVTTYSSKKDL